MIRDASEQSFQADVVERSAAVPVIVDFWAAWCGPCRQLAPLLEAAVEAHGDDVDLVRVDTDANPRLAGSYQIRGIPAVKVFRDGRIVDEFTGALPRADVERFVARLVPSQAERLVAAGDEPSLRRAVELEPNRADARVALARLLLGRGESDEARALLRQVEHDAGAAGLLARLELAADAAAPAEVPDALAALERGEHEHALETLLGAVTAANGATRERIRQVMVGVFGELGEANPATGAYRRRLARALY
jgi:putative thioredoxin